MGYYTDFELSVSGEDADIAKEYLKEISGYRWSGGELHESKWYECDRDLEKASLKYPNVEFVIVGSGEDDFDFWKSTAKNGIVERKLGKVTF